MRKTKKLIAGITSTVLMFGIAGCDSASQQDPMTSEEWDALTKTNQSSPSTSSSFSSSDETISTNSTTDDTTSSYSSTDDTTSSVSTDYENEDLPPIPEDQSCVEWEWDLEDGVWVCEDGSSSYYQHFYYGGMFYRSKPELYKSTDFLNYKNSSAFKGKGTNVNNSGETSSFSNTTVKSSSGFGSGSKSFGG